MEKREVKRIKQKMIKTKNIKVYVVNIICNDFAFLIHFSYLDIYFILHLLYFQL